MKRVCMILICCGALGFAQEPVAATEKKVQLGTAATEKPKYLQSVIEVKNGEVKDLARLLESLAPGGTRVNAHPDLKLISIGTYDPSFLQMAEEVVKRYDVARQVQPSKQARDIELVAYILIASPKGTAGDALPADLEGVAKQLRSLFGYRDLRLLDTALIRTLDSHGGDVSGSVAGLVEGLKVPSTYQLRFKTASSVQERTQIYLDDFHFSMRFPYESGGQGQVSYSDVGFGTDIFMADSQKVVVGKSRIGGVDQALVLVLMARVVS